MNRDWDVCGLIVGQFVSLGLVVQAAILMLVVNDPSAPSPTILVFAVVAMAIIIYMFGWQLQKDFLKYNNTDKSEANFLMIANRIAQFLVPVVGVYWFSYPPKLYQELRRV